MARVAPMKKCDIMVHHFGANVLYGYGVRVGARLGALTLVKEVPDI